MTKIVDEENQAVLTSILKYNVKMIQQLTNRLGNRTTCYPKSCNGDLSITHEKNDYWKGLK